MGTPAPVGSALKRSLRKKTGSRNYDENLSDEIFENQIGSSLKNTKRKKFDLEKETTTEALIALSLGFPIDALLEEEIRAGVVAELDGKEQNDYIVVRNHILAKWRDNIRVWLSKGHIQETVSNECRHLISSAYDFLLYNGHINFGVSPAFMTHTPSETNEGTVLIIGAGLAGLAAARQLLSFGFKVIVLEGRNRAGGRVHTKKMGQAGNYAAVELGGSVITGIDANPLGVLARQLSIPLHKVRDNCPLYKPDGSPVDKTIDSNVETIFNKLLDNLMEVMETMRGCSYDVSLGAALERLRQLYAVARSSEEVQLLDWHFANLEYANAGCLSELSAAHWDQDDPYEMGGDHCFLAGGNWRLIKALCEGIPIFYEKTVEAVRYGSDSVEVVAGDRVFHSDMVLCTVPLGVLKQRAIKFEPELPQRKLAAIERLGFGLLNKVAMVFPSVFWGEELDTFGSLNEDSQKRGEFFMFYCYHTVSGGPVLIALVAGEAAQMFESTDPAVLLNQVLSILRGIYGPKGVEVPDPIETICTRWGSDSFTYGSYSHISVCSSGSDYDILAESIDNRLFFAGEATNRQHPATMHGAFLSGLREASTILQATRLLAQNNPRKPVQKNIGASSDVLADLFRYPDMDLGSFSFVFDPYAEDPRSLGILRVILEETIPKSELALNLYSAISREQANELERVEGGEERRLNYAIKDLGLKLMGSAALVNIEHGLITGLVNARKGRGRHRTFRH